jgi:hypothetical protein
MENKNTIKKLIITYGIILGLSTVFVSVIKYVFGNYLEKSFIESMIGFTLMIVLIVYPIKFLKKENKGYLKLSEALKIGLGISVISGLISVLYIYVFANFIEAEFTNNILNMEVDKLKSSSMTTSDLKKSVEMMKNYMYPMMIAGIIIMNLFVGFLISLITGLALKKEQPIFEN